MLSFIVLLQRNFTINFSEKHKLPFVYPPPPPPAQKPIPNSRLSDFFYPLRRGQLPLSSALPSTTPAPPRSVTPHCLSFHLALVLTDSFYFVEPPKKCAMCCVLFHSYKPPTPKTLDLSLQITSSNIYQQKDKPFFFQTSNRIPLTRASWSHALYFISPAHDTSKALCPLSREKKHLLEISGKLRQHCQVNLPCHDSDYHQLSKAETGSRKAKP